MPTIRIREALNKEDRNAFIDLPWEIYRGDPHWVPPLKFDMKQRLDKKHNPSFRHIDAAFFLAEKDGRVVGRVSASVDRNFVKFQDWKAGHFGFFECIDDADVARALLETAENWVREKGMETVIGPAAYNGNDDDYGCLIEGFTQPVFMHAYNPPYYEKLIEGAGYGRVRELWAYHVTADEAAAPEHIRRFAEHLAQRGDIRLRTIDKKNLQRDLKLWLEVYNEAWSKNWGFQPLEEDEFLEHAKLLRFVIEPELAMFCEVEGKPAGAALTIPNLNEAIAKVDGKLFPFGALKVLWMLKRRKIEGCRVFTLGVKKEFRRLGIGALFYVKILETARRLGYRWGDMSWILDNNDAMNKAIQAMGGTVWRRWQMFEKKL